MANVPGLMIGAFAGNRIGAVRDAKGKSVAAVFSELGATQKAEVCPTTYPLPETRQNIRPDSPRPRPEGVGFRSVAMMMFVGLSLALNVGYLNCRYGLRCYILPHVRTLSARHKFTL